MPVVRVPGRDFDIDVVVFDKDGTLIDLDASWAPVARSWIGAVAGDDDRLTRDLAELLGYDAPAGRLVPDSTFAAGTLGDVGDATAGRLIDVGWSPAAVSSALAAAREAVEAVALNNPADTLADLGPLFSQLTAAGVAVAVLTSDDRAPTVEFLEQVDVHLLVSAVVTADDVDHPKPHPDGLQRIGRALGVAAERTLMVGDSLADHQAARAAGAWFVAVGHGSAASVGADATVACVAELTVA